VVCGGFGCVCVGLWFVWWCGVIVGLCRFVGVAMVTKGVRVAVTRSVVFVLIVVAVGLWWVLVVGCCVWVCCVDDGGGLCL
jgi:hypothetical protein